MEISQKISPADTVASSVFTNNVLESMVEFVVIADMNLRITHVNKATLGLTGYERDELIGKPINTLVSERPFEQKGVDLLRKSGYAANLERSVQKKNGTIAPISLSVSVFKDEQGNDFGFVCVGNDITNRKRAEVEREVIAKVMQGVTATSNLDELLDLIHRAIGGVLYAENCYVALVDPKTELLNMQFFVDKRDELPPASKLGVGLTAYVYRTGRPIIMTPEIIAQLTEQGEVELIGTIPAIWLGVPLRTPSGIIGVLVVQHYDDRTAYSELDLELLVSVGDQIAIAIERERSAETLRISEEQHRLLFETNPHPAFVVDLETLAFLAVNEAAINHYGYSREEFISTITAPDIRPSKDAPDFMDRISRARTGQNIVLELTQHQKKDGTIMDVEISMHELAFFGRRAAIVRINDVTERRRLEAESTVISEVMHGVAKTSNLDELLRLVHQSVGKMLYAENFYVALYDKTTDMLNVPFCVDKFDAVAPPAKLGTGLTAYVLRKGEALLVTPKDIQELIDSGEIQMVGTKPAIWLGLPLRTPEGIVGALVVQHYDDAEAYDQRDVGFLSSVGDQIALAIERKRSDEIVKENEAKFKDLFDNAPVAYHELDTNGCYLRINHTEELMLGYTSDELKGRHPAEIIVEQVSRDATKAKLAGELTLLPVERTFIRKDGTHISVLNQDRLIRGPDGNVTGIRSTLQDITGLKQAEEQLKVFNAKLQQSNRELQDFAYVASHDLQEPLRKVQAFSDRLKTKYGDKLEGEGLDYLERMRNAAGRMRLLIEALLTFSRVSTKAQPFATVDMNQVTTEVLSDLEVKIEETGAAVDFNELPTLDADPMQMRQLIQNLVGNALKFRQVGTPPVITITSQTVSTNGNIYGPQCQIVIKDNGIGFDEKYNDKIFAVFQRLHGRTEYEGSGVGLAICRKIVERHNGNITAHSSPGEGASFAITIPLKQSEQEAI